MLKTIAIIAAPFALLGGCVAYAQSETTTIYKTGTEFITGYDAVWAYEVDRLGVVGHGKLVGYYGGGNPSVIGFGCEGAKAPVIAVAASDLPRCTQVAPIANHRQMLEVR